MSDRVTVSPVTSFTFLIIRHFVENGDVQLRLVESWLDTIVFSCYVAESGQHTILQKCHVPILSAVGQSGEGWIAFSFKVDSGFG